MSFKYKSGSTERRVIETFEEDFYKAYITVVITK